MKHKVLILTLFMCFAASTVFAGGSQPVTVNIPDTIRVQTTIVSSGEQLTQPDDKDDNRGQSTQPSNKDNNGGAQTPSDDDKVYGDVGPSGGTSGGGRAGESTQGSADRLPVTWEIVNLVRNSDRCSLGDLDYYFSHSFTVKIEERTRSPEVGVNSANNNRSLSIGGENPSEPPIQFTIGSKGKFSDFSDNRAGSEFFVILFDNKYLFKFERNTRQDCFTLVSASIGDQEYFIQGNSGELPRLEIDGRDNRITEIRVAQTAPANARPQVVQSAPPPSIRPQDTGGSQGYVTETIQQYGNQNRRPSRDVMGTGIGVVTPEGVERYIRSKNLSTPGGIRDLINLYILEAEFEYINPDIAIAQMLYATNFLSNQRMRTYNYAGLTPTSIWNGTFSNMLTGVKAHIQHLKGYASLSLRGQKVDPRYDILRDLRLLGTVKTLYDLGRWSEDTSYVRNINGILTDLWYYSGYSAY